MNAGDKNKSVVGLQIYNHVTITCADVNLITTKQPQIKICSPKRRKCVGYFL